jgi:hypothetical protein
MQLRITVVERAALTRVRAVNAVFLLILLCALAYTFYPGRLDPDSSSLYRQAMSFATGGSIHDWHSPLFILLFAISQSFMIGRACYLLRSSRCG